MYEHITPESLKAAMLAELGANINTQEGSYTDTLLSPVALEIWNAYTALNAVLPIAFIDETSGEYIDKRCSEIGITRKPGTKASTELQFEGTDGTTVPAGTVCLTIAGLEFVTLHAAVVAEGFAAVEAEAAEIGAAYNIAAGSIVNMYNSISGIRAVTNPQPAVGGADPESDADLVNRYYLYKRKPATSGNVYHYEQWALEVPGVGAVKVTPLENGPGTVGVLIVGQDKQPVDSEIVAACAQNIESNRPVGAGVTVKSAVALAINISATVTVTAETTPERVQEQFAAAVEAYLKSIAFVKYEVLYNQIAYQLLGIDGVEDYSGLTVNGGAGNVAVAADQVPVLGVVEVA